MQKIKKYLNRLRKVEDFLIQNKRKIIRLEEEICEAKKTKINLLERILEEKRK